ncbi:MAG: sulfotransferase [Anaerolineae bacterium]|nr:sulfotransferase [Anaerolineae bacterium]
MKLIQSLPNRTAVILSTSLARVAPAFCRRQLHNPVFFVGCGRSGTTILSQTLARHPDLAVYPGEANELWHPHLYPWTQATLESPPIWADPIQFTQVSVSQPKRANYDAHLQAVFGAYQFLHGGRVFLNKSVMVTFMMPHLLTLFPEAKFIHLVRDGRAVALSYAQKEQEKIQQAATIYQQKGYAPGFDQLLETFAHHWQDHVTEIERQKTALNLTKDRLLELSYENLCAHFIFEMTHLCDFMGVSFAALPLPENVQFRNMNHKVWETLSNVQVELVTQAADTVLQQKGYGG